MSFFKLEEFVQTKDGGSVIGEGNEYEWKPCTNTQFETFTSATKYDKKQPKSDDGSNRRIAKYGDDGKFIDAWSAG